MTPDQIAMANLEVLKMQTWITGLAIFLGPLVGALLTLWIQARKERKDAEMRLFVVLLGGRKGYVTPDITKALNSIDVVFSKHRTVRELWHRYYALLSQPPSEERNHVWLELLGMMGKVCGFRDLTAIELDKFYFPQGHQEEFMSRQRITDHLERVLANTGHLVVAARMDGGASGPTGGAVSAAVLATPVGQPVAASQPPK